MPTIEKQQKEESSKINTSSLVKEGNVETTVETTDASTELLNQKFWPSIQLLSQNLEDLKISSAKNIKDFDNMPVSDQDIANVKDLVQEILSRFPLSDENAETFAKCLENKDFVKQLIIFQRKFRNWIDKVQLLDDKLVVTGNANVNYESLLKNLETVGVKWLKWFVNILSYISLGTIFATRNVARWVSATECHSKYKYDKTQNSFFAQLFAGVPMVHSREKIVPIVNVTSRGIVFSEKVDIQPDVLSNEEKTPAEVRREFFTAYNDNPFVSGQSELTPEYQTKLFNDFTSLNEFVKGEPSLIPVLKFSVGVDGQRIDLRRQFVIDSVYLQLSSQIKKINDPQIDEFLKNIEIKARTNLKQPSEIYGDDSFADKQTMFECQVKLILNRAMGSLVYLKTHFPTLSVAYSTDNIVTQGEQHGFNYDYIVDSSSERMVNLTVEKLKKVTVDDEDPLTTNKSNVDAKKTTTIKINGKSFSIEKSI